MIDSPNAEVAFFSWQFDFTMWQETYFDQDLLSNVYHSLQGFPGELTRILGDGLSLEELISMLDEYFSVVNDYDTMVKILYELHQGEC